MRRFTATFLLFAYIFANTELHQLAKFGAFLKHFAEHQIADPEMTLLAFVEMHYFNGNLMDDDYYEDMQLPFKVTDCGSSSIIHMVPMPDCFVIKQTIPFESGKRSFYDQTALVASHLADIWQPPKLC
jgi:hypothetical protein